MSKIIGNYRLNKKFREGGHSILFHATDLTTNDSVIAKVVPLKSRRAQEIFNSEKLVFEKVKDLNFVYTLSAIDIVTESNYGCFILPKLKGDLLDEIAKQSSCKFDEKLAKHYFKRVLLALENFHQNDIAHLDIKPENVLVDYDGNIYLADFGCAYHDEDESRHYKGITGTDIYSAPEVRSGQFYDPFAADIWSLGILLFVLLTGNWPFHDQNPDYFVANTFAIINDKFGPLLEDLLKQLLQKDPLYRPSVSKILKHPWFSSDRLEIKNRKYHLVKSANPLQRLVNKVRRALHKHF